MNNTHQPRPGERRPEWAVLFPSNPNRLAVPFGRADVAEKFARTTVHGIAVPVYPGPGNKFYHRDGGGKPIQFITPRREGARP